MTDTHGTGTGATADRTNTGGESRRADAGGHPRGTADEAVGELLALLGKRHTLAILRLFAGERRTWRFGELEAALDLSPTTLSGRLAELTAYGFLERTSYDETPPRVEYTATERAEALKPTFASLYRWTRTYGAVTSSGDACTDGAVE